MLVWSLSLFVADYNCPKVICHWLLMIFLLHNTLQHKN
jgi:hypothetical protein